MTMQSIIIHHIGGDRSQNYPLQGRLFLVGSGDENDLVVPDRAIPAIALKIEPFETGYRCESIHWKHFRLNGKKERSAFLKPGDMIEFADQKLVYEEAPALAHTTALRPPRLWEELNRFVNIIGKEQQLQPLLHTIMQILLEFTEGTDIFLFKLDCEGKPQVFESNKKGDPADRFSDTVVQAVIERKKGICIPNTLADPAYKNTKSICDLKLTSVICTPMLIAGKINGLIYIGTHNPAISFSNEDLDAVNLYAAIAGMLMHHIDFIHQQQVTIKRLTGTQPENGIVATSPAMQTVLSSLRAVAASDITVLFSGETGTGKSKIAHVLHSLSPRASNPFVVVNCSSLQGNLLESEMFGHKKGSFTGAICDYNGLFASANGGTLLLDDISELEPQLQAKLLRTLETKTIRPIGSTRETVVDVRVVCASNRNLVEMVRDHAFREDLFYRINQFPITLPPLRKRGEDVSLIAYVLLDQYKALYPNKEIVDFHPDALRIIQTHTWPGNIRELTNAIHHAMLLSHGPLLRLEPANQAPEAPKDFDEATQRFQKQLLENALAAVSGNKEAAAKNLGLSRSTFYRYVQMFGL
jgi:transcriptional regulator with GAF, ATPase, and Fis domain